MTPFPTCEECDLPAALLMRFEPITTTLEGPPPVRAFCLEHSIRLMRLETAVHGRVLTVISEPRPELIETDPPAPADEDASYDIEDADTEDH